MTAQDGWAEHGGVRIHYLDSDPAAAPGGLPLLIVPGLSESAEDYHNLMASLAPRRCVALSLRGRGQSDAPPAGYALDDHLTDIEAVVGHLALNRFCLVAFSRAVPYGAAYVSRHHHLLAGFIVCDYPARHAALPPAWVEQVLAETWRGRPVAERVPAHVITAIQQESRDVPLLNSLSRAQCPVLIIRGGQPGARLSAEEAATYAERLPAARVVTFADSGHDLMDPDYDRFVNTVKSFLEEIDPHR